MAWWSKIWPVPLLLPRYRAVQPPMPLASIGWSFWTQLPMSMLWMCCSAILSPESQAKWYQLFTWYCSSFIQSSRPRFQMPPPSSVAVLLMKRVRLTRTVPSQLHMPPPC